MLPKYNVSQHLPKNRLNPNLIQFEKKIGYPINTFIELALYKYLTAFSLTAI